MGVTVPAMSSSYYPFCLSQTSSDRSGKSSPSFSAALLGVVWSFLTGGVLLALFFLVFTIRFRKNR